MKIWPIDGLEPFTAERASFHQRRLAFLIALAAALPLFAQQPKNVKLLTGLHPHVNSARCGDGEALLFTVMGR